MENLPEKPRIEADLHRVPINSVLLQKYSNMQDEWDDRVRTASRVRRNLFSYSAMSAAESVALSQARGHPDIDAEYRRKKKLIDIKYGDPDQHNWELYMKEAVERKELLEALYYDLGTIKVDERPKSQENTVKNYAYSQDGRQLLYDVYENRLSQNRNLNVLISGKMGGGKSYAALSTGQYANADFSIDKQLSYASVQKFIEITRTLEPGKVAVFDELGLDAGNRDSLSTLNKSLAKLLQSTRYRNLFSIFTVPALSLIDKSVRILSDIILEHRPEQRQGEFDLFIPEVDDKGDVQLFYYRNGDTVIKSVYFPLPSPAISQAYEGIRAMANENRLKDMEDSLAPKGNTKANGNDPELDGRGKNPNSLKNLKHFKGGDNNGE